VQLPPHIRERIEQLSENVPIAELRRSAERLTATYKDGDFASAFDSHAARLAYLHVRLPATFAACSAALGYCAEVLPGFAPKSMLDLGSGPGSATLAGLRRFPSLSAVVAIERDAELAQLGRELLQGAVSHQLADLLATSFPKSDLVVAAYCLGEIAKAQRLPLIDRTWQATSGLLLLIEPGTPEGYARVLSVRDHLLATGAQIVAPCPHAQRCPMQGTKDWCHFAARVERTSLHRQLKGGSLGHEDEKFSYVAFARHSARLPESRIVRHPQQHRGHVKLQLCVNGERIGDAVVTRSQKSEYRAVRHAKWGETWPPYGPPYTGADAD
jgi:ribosomal protein RSM22 (predicted rRNA methylase)